MKIQLNSPTYLLPSVLLLGCIGIFLQHESFLQYNREMSSRAVSVSFVYEPLFVLHVGPQKTATGTLRLYASSHNALLEKDNFYNLGYSQETKQNVLRDLFQYCDSDGVTDQASPCEEKWNKLELILEEQHKQGHSVFLSDPLLNQLSDDTLSRFMSLLQRQSWKVRVVISHRSYYEWVHSNYRSDFDGNTSLWPDDGGHSVPSFPLFLDDTLLRKADFSPLTIKDKWQEYFRNDAVSDIWISQMSKEDEAFPQHFFCRMMPEAWHLCDHLKVQNSNLVRKSPSMDDESIAYDMLAVAAKEKGLVPEKCNWSRSHVAHAIEHRSRELGIESTKDFPSTCIDETQAETFLRRSLKLELQMLPMTSTRRFLSGNRRSTETKHNENFERFKADGRFCSVDADAVMKDEKWKRFLTSLDCSNDAVKASIVATSRTNGSPSANDDESPRTSRPSSVLALYVCDEGSTVLSEAFRQHPQVYSPTWKIEPVNSRLWDMKDINVQLDAIRFLLRLSSNMTTFDLDVKNPIPEAKYKNWVGNSKSTYLKASVCREGHGNKYKWNQCMESVMTTMLCHEENSLDHLILPIRYGFDRAYSRYIHSKKDLYRMFSQFKSAREGTQASDKDGVRVQKISEKEAEYQRFRQQQYIEEYIAQNRLFRGTCPNGRPHNTKVHIFDYDMAKSVGMQKTFSNVFANVGLSHDSDDVNLGRFGDRKPGNYEHFFDESSRDLFHKKQEEYEKWLYDQCVSSDVQYPWCQDREKQSYR